MFSIHCHAWFYNFYLGFKALVTNFAFKLKIRLAAACVVWSDISQEYLNALTLVCESYDLLRVNMFWSIAISAVTRLTWTLFAILQVSSQFLARCERSVILITCFFYLSFWLAAFSHLHLTKILLTRYYTLRVTKIRTESVFTREQCLIL